MVIKSTNPIQQAMVRNIYKSFTKSCLSGAEAPNTIKSNFLQVSKTFYKNGMSDEFYNNTNKLCVHLLKNGRLKLANVLLGELGKIYLRLGKISEAETTINKSLTISKLFNDEIHVFARLTDLEFLYKDSNRQDKLIKILKEKIKTAEIILKDYELYVKNYKSISRPATDYQGIQIQLAYAYNDIAEITLRENPKQSIRLLQQAKKIYEDMGRHTESNYLEVKLKNISKRIHKYDSRKSMHFENTK